MVVATITVFYHLNGGDPVGYSVFAVVRVPFGSELIPAPESVDRMPALINQITGKIRLGYTADMPTSFQGLLGIGLF
jgi:hypothetical protein